MNTEENLDRLARVAIAGNTPGLLAAQAPVRVARAIKAPIRRRRG